MSQDSFLATSDMDTDSCRQKRAAAVLVISCCSELLATEQPKDKIKVYIYGLRKKERSVYNISGRILLVLLTQISFRGE